MMGDVVKLPGVMDTPDEVLESQVGKLQTCIVLGRDHDNNVVFSTTEMDLADFIYLLESTKTAYFLSMLGGGDKDA